MLLKEEESFKVHPLGPLSCVLDDTQLECLQQLIPACALNTILVGDIHDIEPVKKLPRSRGLPIPDIGVADLNPDEKLYELPPLKALGKQLLHGLPPSVANYFIDMFEIDLHPKIKRP